MEKSEELKEIVKEKYGEIAKQSMQGNETSCCADTSCCSSDTVDYTTFSLDYSKLKGYNPDADLNLGCGVPTEFAQIKEGHTVIDLGSGAGNDVFVARALTGEKGKVIGIDFTEEMITKARINNDKMGFNNVEFRYGDIEKLPVNENQADVIISNCVLNLVPDKKKAFSEIYRVLKPGGHFSVSDLVIDGELPEKLKNAAAVYAGCVGGAVKKEEYLNLIKQTGFENVTVQKEKAFTLPDEVLLKYISKEELAGLRSSGTKILSINVYAEKPAETQGKQKCC
jgi:ubiquinone/menaquinone biosynthesis C-methylase UbiE